MKETNITPSRQSDPYAFTWSLLEKLEDMETVGAPGDEVVLERQVPLDLQLYKWLTKLIYRPNDRDAILGDTDARYHKARNDEG